MTWDETIKFIRTQPEYRFLVEKAYFEEELHLNVERFRRSEEFIETLNLLRKYKPAATKILDIGSGNGITAISFALEGYQVTTVEPDPSETIGAGAIRKLKWHYHLENVEIFEAFAEEIKFADDTFDIVYARQCMHHAYNLKNFVYEAGRVLKTNGMFITVRDHVIFNSKDKEWFLESHPLQKYYGGENAFMPIEYRTAIKNAGLTIKEELKFYDTVINYFPASKGEIDEIKNERSVQIERVIKKKLTFLSKIPFVKKLAYLFLQGRTNILLDEKKVPGRMYSYIAIKQ